MPITNTVYIPTFNHAIDPLLSISPLVDLNSNCLTHIVDTDGVFHLQAHKSPIVLSYKHKILTSSLSYQKSFSGVRYPRCLLTIAAFFMSWEYDLEALVSYIFPRNYDQLYASRHPIKAFGIIFPQSFIILTDKSGLSVNSIADITGASTCTDDLSSITTLQLSQNTKKLPRIILGVPIQSALDRLSFQCSTLESCHIKIVEMETTKADFIHGSWNYFGGGDSSDGDPFQRNFQASIEQGVESFILRPPNQRFNSTELCSPTYYKGRTKIVETPTEVIPVGRTAGAKFVTTAGVFHPKASYRVYFSPFLPGVWLGVLISASMTVTVLTAVFRMQRSNKEAAIGLLHLTSDLATWTFAAAIGQSYTAIPLDSWSFCKEVVRIAEPVVVAWLIFSTLLVGVYGAIFNADAATVSYYRTNYTKFHQLPLDISTYILVNESYVRQFLGRQYVKDCSTADRLNFCRLQKHVLDVCTIEWALGNAYVQSGLDADEYRMAATNPNWNTIEQQRLDEIKLKMKNLFHTSEFLCANTESLRRVIAQSEKPLAFLISGNYVQKYWELFVQIMQSNPNIKVANNFDDEESFFVLPVAFEFTSGLHPAFIGSVVGRMKVLVSSGIYGLWEKWHRIKFTEGGLQYAAKNLNQENKVDPLSFDNSATSWVFLAQAVAWLGATGIFIGELIFRPKAGWLWKLPQMH